MALCDQPITDRAAGVVCFPPCGHRPRERRQCSRTPTTTMDQWRRWHSRSLIPPSSGLDRWWVQGKNLSPLEDYVIISREYFHFAYTFPRIIMSLLRIALSDANQTCFRVFSTRCLIVLLFGCLRWVLLCPLVKKCFIRACCVERRVTRYSRNDRFFFIFGEILVSQ